MNTLANDGNKYMRRNYAPGEERSELAIEKG